MPEIEKDDRPEGDDITSEWGTYLHTCHHVLGGSIRKHRSPEGSVFDHRLDSLCCARENSEKKCAKAYSGAKGS